MKKIIIFYSTISDPEFRAELRQKLKKDLEESIQKKEISLEFLRVDQETDGEIANKISSVDMIIAIDSHTNRLLQDWYNKELIENNLSIFVSGAVNKEAEDRIQLIETRIKAVA